MPYKDKEKQKEVQRKHYQNNKDKYLNAQYNRRMERARWFFEYKSTLKCSKCPEHHPSCIQFHHTNPDNKRGDVCGMVNSGYSQKTILKEIAKCIVLCANCHAKLHWQENIDNGAARVSPKYSDVRQ